MRGESRTEGHPAMNIDADANADADADADARTDRTDVLQRAERHIYSVAQTHLNEYHGSVNLVGGSE